MDAVPGQEQGVGCGRGAMALVLHRQVVRETVVVTAGDRGRGKTTGGLQDARRTSVAADRDDQLGAGRG
ncbi:hypothetical protein [Streptomyces finlayi]|uniref:hypothetical protein n=1 Tax=Streptomyces finlayi TaxID=67296 RepID=UPI00215657DC|nr:hypothetical protein [Streptomyces finlayi]